MHLVKLIFTKLKSETEAKAHLQQTAHVKK